MLMLNVLQVARIDASQAGYILTRNHSTFLETDGAIAWVYSCEKRISPLMRLKTCHNYIPILYTGTTMFVDPITRIALTKELAPEIPCSESKDMPFHLDLDNEESWYKLVPFPAPTKAPLKFSPKIIRQTIPFHTFDSVQAGIYNQKDLETFWTRLQLGIREDGILKVLIQKLTYDRYSKRRDGSPNFNSPNRNPNLYFDNFISPEYWENKFKGTFGVIAFYMEKLALLFSLFLFIKFMMEVVSVIMRAFEIQKLSNRTMHLGKVLFSSIFNVFYITAITNLFREDDYEEINTSKTIQDGKTKLTKTDVKKNSSDNYDVLEYKSHHRLYPKLKKQHEYYGKYRNDRNSDSEIPKC